MSSQPALPAAEPVARPPGEPPALRASGLGRRYRRNWGLRDCTVEIPAGRIVALVGPNGAGKTTLLRLAAGLLAPSTGEVEVLGGSPHHDPAVVMPRIGFLGQDAPLYRGFKVAELLRYGQRLNPSWDMDQAHRRLEALGIPLDRRARALSGGQRAQVALTIALAKGAEVLLLDEPMASLDPLARRDFLRGLLEAATVEGLTVVLSSHILAELERACDYLIILTGGRVRVAGDIDRLLTEHRLLIGPPDHADRLAGQVEVVKVSRKGRQATVLARTGGVLPGPGWQVMDVSLEQLVLAYLERGSGAPAAAADTPSPPATEVRA